MFDSGDLELCFGSSESALVDIESRAAEILRDGKLPLLLGGEHLVTLGAVRAAVRKYPDLHIVHFDAHADLRDDYLGAQLSHACVPVSYTHLDVYKRQGSTVTLQADSVCVHGDGPKALAFV